MSTENVGECGVCCRCLDQGNDGSTIRRPSRQLMVLCAVCRNKRCPHAEWCGYACTHSNEPYQVPVPIRSLPVPSDPSREDGGLLGLLQSLLQEPGSPPPIPTEAMAEFIIRDAASRLEHLENFKATVHSLLDEMGVRKYEGETCRIRRRLASLRTALRELAEVLARISQWDHMDRAHDGPYWRKEIAEVLSRHSGLLDGEPKKENER